MFSVLVVVTERDNCPMIIFESDVNLLNVGIALGSWGPPRLHSIATTRMTQLFFIGCVFMGHKHKLGQFVQVM